MNKGWVVKGIFGMKDGMEGWRGEGMKERVSHDAYTKEMENFASDNISSLDTWVFDKVSFYQHYT